MITIGNKHLRPPSRLALIGEARAALDLVRMLVPLASVSLTTHEAPVSRDIIVVPGFGSDDRYTAPLRHYLNRRGHRAEGWGLGRNLAGTDLPHTLDDLHPRWTFDHRDRQQVGRGCQLASCTRPVQSERASYRHQRRAPGHGL